MRRLSIVLLVLTWGCGGSDATAGCSADGECPVHQLCESGACRTGCIGDGECGGVQVCSAHGRCIDAPASDLSEFHDASAQNSDLSSLPDLSSQPDLSAGCGDGHVDPGEECDDGPGNSDDAAAAATCTSACKRRAICGALASSNGAAIDPATGHCYVAWPGPVTWAAAQQRCLASGGTLAGADSPAEEALLESLAGGSARWVGLRASNSDGDCAQVSGAGFNDAPCGWPATGLLPSAAPSSAGFICESGCGNGVVEAGEGCDPPGAACTGSCQIVRACSEGMTSPASGHCYFLVAATSDYPAALTACPAGTHLATLETPDETALAEKLVTTDTWIALRAPTTVGAFAWDAMSSEPFVAARYHGFIDDEPNHNASPTCTRLVPTGWRDQICTSKYPRLCERE
jgi:Lectin C-type domain